MTEKNKTGVLALVLVTALVAADWAMAAPPSAKAEKTYYRYRNDRGILVIDDNVPADLAKNGYEVITVNGIVLERVAAELTADQLVAKQKELEREQEAQRIREWEESLIRRYRSVEEIEAARERVLREFDNQVEILRGNLASQRSQVEAQQQRAADLERRGRPVYDSIRDNIAALQREMETTESTIAIRQKEIAQVRAEFDADVAQFKKILTRRKK